MLRVDLHEFQGGPQLFSKVRVSHPRKGIFIWCYLAHSFTRDFMGFLHVVPWCLRFWRQYNKPEIGFAFICQPHIEALWPSHIRHPQSWRRMAGGLDVTVWHRSLDQISRLEPYHWWFPSFPCVVFWAVLTTGQRWLQAVREHREEDRMADDQKQSSCIGSEFHF